MRMNSCTLSRSKQRCTDMVDAQQFVAGAPQWKETLAATCELPAARRPAMTGHAGLSRPHALGLIVHTPITAICWNFNTTAPGTNARPAERPNAVCQVPPVLRPLSNHRQGSAVTGRTAHGVGAAEHSRPAATHPLWAAAAVLPLAGSWLCTSWLFMQMHQWASSPASQPRK